MDNSDKKNIFAIITEFDKFGTSKTTYFDIKYIYKINQTYDMNINYTLNK